MVGRPYITTHVDPFQVAPLLSRVLPEATLRELAEAAVRDQPSLLRGIGPHPTAEMLVAQALGGSDTTAGAVLFALEHELRGVMEELSAASPAQLAEELTVCEILERRSPAHIVLALLLDARPQVNSLGTVLLDEYFRLRESVEERPPGDHVPQSREDDWEETLPAGETVLPGAAGAQAEAKRRSETDHDLASFLRQELETMMQENRQLLSRVSQLEERLAQLARSSSLSAPPSEAGLGAAEAPDLDDFGLQETAGPPPESPSGERSLEESMQVIFGGGPEMETAGSPALPAAKAAPEASTPPPAEKPKPGGKILSGEHILLLGGDAQRQKEYEAMLKGLGARPIVVPKAGAWDEPQIKSLVGEADYIVALGNTILDANVSRILKVADEHGVRHFRYHSTAVEGARHFLLSLAQEGLI